jgi:hypothetical protein
MSQTHIGNRAAQYDGGAGVNAAFGFQDPSRLDRFAVRRLSQQAPD